MGKLITFVILAALAAAIGQGLMGIMGASKLETLMRDTVDSAKGWNEREVVDDLVGRANREGLALEPKQVEVTIAYVEGAGVPGAPLAQRGIVANQKRVTIKAQHRYKILGLERSTDVTQSALHTLSANVVPSRNLETIMGVPGGAP